MPFFRLFRQIGSTSRVFSQVRHYSKHPTKLETGASSLFRVDSLNFKSSSSGLYPFSLNLLELVFFRIASIQNPSGKDVVRHQGSTNLIGTTSNNQIAKKLSNSWTQRNSILTIDRSIVEDHIFDVDRIVSQVGTSFFTKIPEQEWAMCLLPIFAVKEIQVVDSNQTVKNPLYTGFSAMELTEFKKIYSKQIEFLKTLYLQGQYLSDSERKKALNEVIESLVQFYNTRLDETNPFQMSLGTYQETYGNEETGKLLKDYSQSESIESILFKDGDKLFMENEYYRRLKGKKCIDDMIQRANEENGYGHRSSYTYE